MCDSPGVAEAVTRTRRRASSERVVLVAALLMCAAQLGFRAWAVFGAWFQFDDFYFLSRAMDPHFGLDDLFSNYGGHLMPAGYLATWLDLKLAPFSFTPVAAELLALQALADAGALVFLFSAFGRRPGVLPPLAVYLFTVVSLPALVWWAAGINQLPFLAAIWWAGWTHLRYLRGRRLRWALATMAITALSLCFTEKSLLVFVLFGFLALGYFATGSLAQRARTVWTTYRVGVVLYAVVVVAYVALYVWRGLALGAGAGQQQSVGQVAFNLVVDSYATGIVGGPLHWAPLSVIDSLADPNELVIGVAVLAIAGLVYATWRSHRRSLRAWLLPAIVLVADVAVLAGGRSVLGPSLALEYRYLTELAALSAIALGLAVLPLRGAVESAEQAEPAPVVTHRALAGTATVLVAVLGTVSSFQYAHTWQSKHDSRDFFLGVEASLRTFDHRVPMADVGVPQFLLWGYSWPYNSASHVLRRYADRITYPDIVNDSIYGLGDDGSIEPVAISAVRRSQANSSKVCPFPATDGAVTVTLDGPFIGTDWWVHLTYDSPASAPIHVHVGTDDYDVTVEKGLHSLFFRADAPATGRGVRTITLGDVPTVAGASGFCVSDAELGTPVPVG